jgi:hypothetical protein
VIAEKYHETKKILEARYGDKNRIIQAQLDYLEDVKLIKYVTTEALNSTYIDRNRRIHTLRALGDVNGYGRVLAPKILCAFPDDMSPLDGSYQAGGRIGRGHTSINGILVRRSGRSPHHTEVSWRVSQLIVTLPQRWRFTCTPSLQRQQGRALRGINRFVYSATIAAIRPRIVRRLRTKESKPMFPLPQQGAYRIKLRKEGDGKEC